MATNPSPAAVKAAEAIFATRAAALLSDSKRPGMKDYATLIDLALTDERRAAEEMVKFITETALYVPSTFDERGENVVANYRRTRGGE